MGSKMVLDILNTKTGHTTLQFNKDDPEELKAAEDQITSMLRSGFSIFVEKDGATERVTNFDASRGVYLIGKREIPAEGTTATAAAPTAGGCDLETSPLMEELELV